MDEEAEDKDCLNSGEELQTMKLAEMTIYGKLVGDLLEAVGSPYGILVDGKVRRLYGKLNTLILELDNEIDEDCRFRVGADFGFNADVYVLEESDQMKAELMDDRFAVLVSD